MEDSLGETWTGQREEDLGVLGRVTEESRKPVSDASIDQGHPPRAEAASTEDKEREHKEQLAKMAANMIITEEPRGNYFVRNPGL